MGVTREKKGAFLSDSLGFLEIPRSAFVWSSRAHKRQHLPIRSGGTGAEASRGVVCRLSLSASFCLALRPCVCSCVRLCVADSCVTCLGRISKSETPAVQATGIFPNCECEREWEKRRKNQPLSPRCLIGGKFLPKLLIFA